MSTSPNTRRIGELFNQARAAGDSPDAAIRRIRKNLPHLTDDEIGDALVVHGAALMRRHGNSVVRLQRLLDLQDRLLRRRQS